MRTADQRRYHASKEREYRRRRKAERDAAIARLSESAAVLRKAGYTPGQILDLILALD